MRKTDDTLIAVIIIIILVMVGIWAMISGRGARGRVVDYNKIAIPAEGTTLNSKTSMYFSRSPYFIVYDSKKDVFWSAPNPFYKEKHAVGMRVAAMLVMEAMGVMLASNMGPEPCRYFNNNKVKVFLGASGTVKDAITQYKNGLLVKTTKANVPTHYGVPGAKPCPNVMGQPTKRIDPKNLARAGVNIKAANLFSQGVGSIIINCPYCSRSMVIQGGNAVLPPGIICTYCGRHVSLKPLPVK